jgi:DNA polymerase I-like protein with 3'-5' exonuclease and polymerase domains
VRKHKPVVIDLETKPIAPDSTVEALWLIGYAYRAPDGEIEVGQVVWKNGIEWPDLAAAVAKGNDEELEFIQYVCRNGGGYRPVFHNGQFDKRWLEHGGFEIREWDDTLLMGYALNPNIDLVSWPVVDPATGNKRMRAGKYSLAAWGQRGVCSAKIEYKQGFERYSDAMADYNVGDVVATLELDEYLEPQLREDRKAYRYYRHHLIPMVDIIIHMTQVGLYLDPDEVQELGFQLVDKLDTSLKSIRQTIPCVPGKKLAPVKNPRKNAIPAKDGIYSARDIGKCVIEHEGFGKSGQYEYVYRELSKFNPNSPDQKRYALRALIPDWEYSQQTNAGNDTTDSKELTMMATEGHEIAQLLLDYSGYYKLYNSFVQPLPNFVSPKDGRIHASWYNYSTKTGRLSCRQPNLQQIPVRSELGKQYRKSVKAQREGYTLVQWDLSNIELRVLAWLLVEMIDPEEYPDSALLFNWFQQGKDVHQMKADFISEVATVVTRPESKTITFGDIYGMGALKCARQLNCSIKKAKALLMANQKAMPSVDALRQTLLAKARDKGGLIYNPFGRRLYYPNLCSEDNALRARAERQVFNGVIQSTASDVFCYLLMDGWQYIMEAAAMFCAIVHDEGIVECPIGNSEWLVSKLKPVWNRSDILQGMQIRTDFHIAPNWVEAKD